MKDYVFTTKMSVKYKFKICLEILRASNIILLAVINFNVLYSSKLINNY